MTQPMDRNARLPALGPVDREEGEIWVENPFLLAGGGNNLSAFERNRVYLNLKGGAFLDASFATGADIDSDSRSVVAADFDRDGALDLLVGSAGGGPLRLFRNDFPPVRRVAIELRGVESNRPGIGSRIVVHAGGRRIVRDVFPANGGFGQGPAELLIGVGDAEKIDKLSVRWPTGKLQEFRDLPVDRRLSISEGSSRVERSGLTPARSGG